MVEDSPHPISTLDLIRAGGMDASQAQSLRRTLLRSMRQGALVRIGRAEDKSFAWAAAVHAGDHHPAAWYAARAAEVQLRSFLKNATFDLEQCAALIESTMRIETSTETT
jgi:hypothetical protein